MLSSEKSEQCCAAIAEAARHASVPEYEELTPCLKEVTKIWDQMLSAPVRSVTTFDTALLTSAVQQGRLLVCTLTELDSCVCSRKLNQRRHCYGGDD